MKIFEINDIHNINKVSLGEPQILQGGSTYFTKILINNENFYIQLPKCYSKNGINRTKRDIYCDFVYSNSIIENFIKLLKNIIINSLYDKRNIWFQNPLTKEDIINMFSPIVKILKNNIIIRTFIEYNKTISKNNLTIYNEDCNELNINDIDIDCKFIPLIKIDGIKFSTKSFELSIKLVQMMQLNKEEIPTIQCLIKQNNLTLEENNKTNNLEDISNTINDNLNNDSDNETDIESDNDTDNSYYNNVDNDSDIYSDDESINNESINNENTNNETTNNESIDDEIIDNESINNESIKNEKINNENNENNNNENNTKNLNNLEEVLIDDLDISDPNKLQEINIKPVNNDSINLREPYEVYYNIYKNARKKAKNIRQQAINAYLEVEKIKNQYCIEDINDSEDSENELNY